LYGHEDGEDNGEGNEPSRKPISELVSFDDLPSLYKDILTEFNPQKAYLLDKAYFQFNMQSPVFKGAFVPINVDEDYFYNCENGEGCNAFFVFIDDDLSNSSTNESSGEQTDETKRILMNLVTLVHEMYGHGGHYFPQDHDNDSSPDEPPSQNELDNYCKEFVKDIEEEFVSFYEGCQLLEWLYTAAGDGAPDFKEVIGKEIEQYNETGMSEFSNLIFFEYLHGRQTGDWEPFKLKILQEYALSRGFDFISKYANANLDGSYCGEPFMKDLEALITPDEPNFPEKVDLGESAFNAIELKK